MYGAFDIDSMPPVTTSSTSPARIIESAISTARIDDAHTLLIVSAGVSFGRPAAIAAWRAGAWPVPPWSTCPMTTYCGSCASIPTRSSAARTAIAPSPAAGHAASPPPSLPNGVRTAATITLRVTRSTLADEARVASEAPRERGRQRDHRFEVVERADLRRRVHVAKRD